MQSMRSYRTAKGTELPLLNLRGKEYLEVKYRLVWFREDHPDWSIETELVSVTDVSAYARAAIRDEAGRIIATSHKFESIQGFPDFIEKAETGAIGRALALIGYGTQFCADELDEGSRIVDAPVPNRGHRQERWTPVRGKTEAAVKTNRDEASAGTKVDAKENAPEDIGTETTVSSPEPGEYMINFGRKYKGRKVKEIPKSELQSYLRWLENSDVRPGTALAHQVKYLRDAYERMYVAKTNESTSQH